MGRRGHTPSRDDGGVAAVADYPPPCNALFEVSCWNQSLALTGGSSTRGAYLVANALVFSTAASRLHAALLTPPPPKLFRVVQHVLETCAHKSVRESSARPETLANTALAIASQFDVTDASTVTSLVAVLHEAFERPHASDAEASVAAVWSAADAGDSLHRSVGIPSEKLIATKRFIITVCAKRAIERSRYVTTSRSGTNAVEGWALALRALAESSASVEWLDELAPSILDAMQPPAVAIGKAAAPPPISTSHPMIRTRLYDLLASAVTRHPRLAEDVNGDEGADGADARSVFFIAVARAAIGEIAYSSAVPTIVRDTRLCARRIETPPVDVYEASLAPRSPSRRESSKRCTARTNLPRRRSTSRTRWTWTRRC